MKLHNTIFSTKELNSKAKAAFPNGIPNFDEKIKKIENWQENIYSGKITSLNEEELKPLFLSLFFGEILDYDLQNPNVWNLYLESKTSFDTTKADAALGFFSLNEKQEIEKDIRAVVEIKDARTTLDKPQYRADFKGSAVEQCLMYAAKSGENCKWVIVSNFLEIRLYLSSDMNKYEYFDVLELNQPSEFNRFYYLLAKNQLFNEKKSSQIDILLEKRLEKERNITFEFYEHYKYLREVFLQHLKLHNPQKNPLDLLQYAQTVIDRIVFVCVIKDYDFIQYNVLSEIVDISQKSWASDKLELWRQIKYFFKALDDGLPNRIHRLNGGLFKYNEKIDELIIKDVFLKQLLKLTNYDFESDLNINILGHIFEQSITDIENLKKEITENKKIEYSETDDEINYKTNAIETNKRKKEGIFYTPENITHYIVKYTIGSWLEEQKAQIGLNDLVEFPKTEFEKKKHLERWEKYIEVLKNIKILDPACGSGAFLTQAFDFLLKEWTMVFDVVDKLKENIKSKKSKDLFETAPTKMQHSITKIKKEIVNNNLFGVDLNFESVEITKLGLWLKSASKVEALAILDSNIKCGNSLISDKNITEKAFVWEEEFPEILSQGGFDIIVGNPPYVSTKVIDVLEKKYFTSHYKTAIGQFDLYGLFIERSIQLLNKKAMFGFITSNTYLSNKDFLEFRKYLFQNVSIKEITNLGETVFKEANLDVAILMFSNNYNQQNKIKITLNNADFENNKFHFISQNRFNNVKNNYEIKLNSKEEDFDLIDKLFENKIELSKILDLPRGIEIGSNSYKISKEYRYNYHKLLVGKDISKYSINFSNKYIKFENDLSVFKNLEIYQQPKILIQRIRNLTLKTRIVATLDSDNYLCTNTLRIGLLKNNKFDIRYVLSILNSKVINWIFSKFFLNKDIYAYQLERLPIPEISLLQQKEYIDLVNEILELKKNIFKIKHNFTKIIASNFKTKRIEFINDFYKFDYNKFFNELKKDKVQIPFKQQTELEEYFNENKNQIISDIEKANSLENQINHLVYNLYDLTDSEIKIIEKIVNC